MKIFAHRGASTQYAEHTRAAFAHALAVGVDGIETDVQLTADGQLLCWHDATLNRTSTGRGPVRVHRLKELRQLDVHSWKQVPGSYLPSGYGHAQNQLMTLDELTDLLLGANREVELAVEMKISAYNDAQVADAVLQWLQRWGWDATTGTLSPNGVPSRVTVSVMSFSLDALDRVAQVVPTARLCPLFQVHSRHALQLGPQPTELISSQLLGPSVGWLAHHPATLRSLIHAGHIIRMWTVESELQFRTALQFGVQQVTVNDPAWVLDRVRQLVS